MLWSTLLHRCGRAVTNPVVCCPLKLDLNSNFRGLFMKLCRRYRLEVRLKTVKAYLDNEGSYGILVKRYGISGRAVLQRWVKTYQAFGEKGLITSRENRECIFKRIEEAALKGSQMEKGARVVHSLRGSYRLKDIPLRPGVGTPDESLCQRIKQSKDIPKHVQKRRLS